MTQEWRAQARCHGEDLTLFFPTSSGGSSFGDDAKRVCSVCPVRLECLEWAMARPAEFGIWGGLTEAERRTLRAQRRAAA
jgi:WhiB family redox-sensing transcriptional regulator